LRGGDLREAFLYGISALAVRVVPERRWSKVSDYFAGLTQKQTKSRTARFGRSVQAVLGSDYQDVAGLYRRGEMHAARRRFYIAALRREKNWTPSIELLGFERIKESRDRGRSIVLWFDSFAHFSVIGKMAFAQAGHPFWQLSSHYHGFSGTTFGLRYLNPLQIGLELDYLAGRIAFDKRSMVTATRKVVQVLDAGGTVAITNNTDLGRWEQFPFGASAKLRIATTPLKLALRHKAALFPVNVLEIEPLTRYRVTVGPEIEARSVGDADPLAAMAAQYIDYLLPLVRAYPDQWTGWRPIANAIARERDATNGNIERAGLSARS
jgi:lauroyl/myristoyl acyltransferase